MSRLGRGVPNRPIIRRAPRAAAGPDPGTVLDIGTSRSNHFFLQYAVDGAGSTATATQADIAAGFSSDPYFTTTPDGLRVKFQVRADSALIGGSTFPRSELRETFADGTDAAIDVLTGTHSLRTIATITHLPSADPEVVVCQLHNGTTDRISLRTQLVTGTPRLRVRINGSTVALDSTSPINPGGNDIATGNSEILDVEWEYKIVVVGGLTKIYVARADGSVGNMTTPVVTSSALTSTGSASWYFKAGAYAQFDATSAGSSTEYVSVEHRGLQVSHSVAVAEGGAGAAGAVATAQPVKVAAVSGVCSAGAAGSAQAKKAATHTSVGATGAGPSGRAVKVSPQVSAGVAAAAGRATVTTYVFPPVLRIVVATSQPSRRFREVGSVQVVASIVLAPGVPGNGSVVGGAAAQALPRKVAVVSGVCSAGAITLGGAHKAARPQAAASVAGIGQASARKAAPQSGGATAGAVSLASARKAAVSRGTGSAGSGPGALVRKAATPLGLGIAGFGPAAGTRKLALSRGLNAAGEVSTGAARKAAPVVATSTAGAASRQSGLVVRAVAGVISIGGHARAQVTKLAMASATAPAGTAPVGVPRKAAVTRGSAVAGTTAYRSGMLTRAVSAVVALGASASAAARRIAAATATGSLGATSSSVPRRNAAATVAITLGAASASSPRRSSSVVAASALGAAPTGAPGRVAAALARVALGAAPTATAGRRARLVAALAAGVAAIRHQPARLVYKRLHTGPPVVLGELHSGPHIIR